jgi:hypothetical protein
MGLCRFAPVSILLLPMAGVVEQRYWAKKSAGIEGRTLCISIIESGLSINERGSFLSGLAMSAPGELSRSVDRCALVRGKQAHLYHYVAPHNALLGVM